MMLKLAVRVCSTHWMNNTHIIQAGRRDTVRIVTAWARPNITAQKRNSQTSGVNTLSMKELGAQVSQ